MATLAPYPTDRTRPTRREMLESETFGGALLLLATVLALVAANSGLGDLYRSVRDAHLGPSFGGFTLDLSVGHWAADGLLAVFFFTVGLELKKEFTLGDLRDVSTAAVPMAAAIGGVLTPAVLYTLANLGGSAEARDGWAIPAATDIAFALAVLAVVGRALPTAVRTFLMTLAVVDDLVVILIIAIFYSSDLKLGYLALALVPMALYAFVVRRYETFLHRKAWSNWVILLPIGIVVWALFLNSGVHATIAGVLLGFLVPVHVTERTRAAEAPHGLAETVNHRIALLSALVCVPLFAFFSAGVQIGGLSGLATALREPTSYGVVLGLVVGKPLGIVAMTWLVTRLPRFRIDDSLGWPDILGVGLLGGIGFTVSLLISELSFTTEMLTEDAKIAILVGSTLSALLGGGYLAALLGGGYLALRNRRYAKA